MKCILYGLLGTFVSRYSEYEGYWLLGFLVAPGMTLQIDLLSDEPLSGEPTPESTAVTLARAKFRDQLLKAGYSQLCVVAAMLTVEEVVPTRQFGGGVSRYGYDVRFRAAATMDDGRSYHREVVVFVAPHDPAVELRSGGR
ncbi:MAG: hypothetical protein V4850_27040 [Myxococcota bacterium]